MTTTRPSLLERAAEIYDFSSGLPAAPTELPPRRRSQAPRVERLVEGPAPRPAAAEPRPASPALHKPEARPRPLAPPVHHEEMMLNRAHLAEAGLLAPEAPASGLAEEMRLVKRRLLNAVDAAAEQGDADARLVLVASGKPGEGKTFVALNLALSIASEADRSVLLIDGDTAKPEVLARLGLEDDRPGFMDALADPGVDPERLVLATDIRGLALLPSGRRERNVPELLASARTQDVLARLLTADPRRIVLIDSTPALAASAAGVLAGHAGHTLVVVKADGTSEPDLKETLDLLSGCDRLSLVLNSAAFQVGGRRFAQYEEYL